MPRLPLSFPVYFPSTSQSTFPASRCGTRKTGPSIVGSDNFQFEPAKIVDFWMYKPKTKPLRGDHAKVDSPSLECPVRKYRAKSRHDESAVHALRRYGLAGVAGASVLASALGYGPRPRRRQSNSDDMNTHLVKMPSGRHEQWQQQEQQSNLMQLQATTKDATSANATQTHDQQPPDGMTAKHRKDHSTQP